MTMEEPRYVHGLRVQDFLRCELVEVRFAGPGLTVFSGENAAGKSSILKAAEALFGGKASLPDVPVRVGAERAELEADLGDRVVTLKVKPDRSTTLTVRTRDGMKATSPQRMLDELKGAIGFSPLAFLRLKPEEQAEALRKLVGLDTRVLDEEHAKVYAERTTVGREGKLLAGQLSGIVVPPEVEPAEPLPEVEEVDIADLAQRQQAAVTVKANNDRLRRDMETLRAGCDATAREVQGIADQIALLQTKLEEKTQLLARARVELDAQAAEVAALVDPDTSALTREIASAKEHNLVVRKAREVALAEAARVERARADRARAEQAHAAKEQEVTAKRAEWERLTARIDEIDAEKARALTAVTFPCPGLGIDGGTVTYQGVPLSQASGAEGIRVVLEIGAALNPKLRLLLIDEGDALDLTRLRQVADWATERDYEIWMTRVPGDQPTGVEIVAGRVAADHRGEKTEAV